MVQLHLNADMTVASGTVAANGQYGAGGLPQHFLVLHGRGSNDDDLTDVTTAQAAYLIGEAVELGRYGGALPDEPR